MNSVSGVLHLLRECRCDSQSVQSSCSTVRSYRGADSCGVRPLKYWQHGSDPFNFLENTLFILFHKPIRNLTVNFSIVLIFLIISNRSTEYLRALAVLKSKNKNFAFSVRCTLSTNPFDYWLSPTEASSFIHGMLVNWSSTTDLTLLNILTGK